jgi:hypothetical protein
MEKQMTDTNRLLPKFFLGRIVATPGALEAEEANQNAGFLRALSHRFC